MFKFLLISVLVSVAEHLVSEIKLGPILGRQL